MLINLFIFWSVCAALRLNPLPKESLLLYLITHRGFIRFPKYIDYSKSKETLLSLSRSPQWQLQLAKSIKTEEPLVAEYAEAIEKEPSAYLDYFLNPTMMLYLATPLEMIHRRHFDRLNVNKLLGSDYRGVWRLVDWTLADSLTDVYQLHAAVELLLPKASLLQKPLDLIRRLCHLWALLAAVSTGLGPLKGEVSQIASIMTSIPVWTDLLERIFEDSDTIDFFYLCSIKIVIGCIQRLYEPTGLFATMESDDHFASYLWNQVGLHIPMDPQNEGSRYEVIHAQSLKMLRHRQLLMLGAMLTINQPSFSELGTLLLDSNVLEKEDLIWLLSCLTAHDAGAAQLYATLLSHRHDLIIAVQQKPPRSLFHSRDTIDALTSRQHFDLKPLSYELEYGFGEVNNPHPTTAIFRDFSLRIPGATIGDFKMTAGKAILTRLQQVVGLMEGSTTVSPSATRHPLAMRHLLDLTHWAYLLGMKLPFKLHETIKSANSDIVPDLLTSQIQTMVQVRQVEHLARVLNHENDDDSEEEAQRRDDPERQCVAWNRHESFTPAEGEDEFLFELHREDLQKALSVLWRKIVAISKEFRQTIAPHVQEAEILEAILNKVFD